MCIAISSFAQNSRDGDWLPNSGNTVDAAPTNSVSWSFLSGAASIGFSFLASACLGVASVCSCVNKHQHPAIQYERSIDTKPVQPEVGLQLQTPNSNDSAFYDGVGVSFSWCVVVNRLSKYLCNIINHVLSPMLSHQCNLNQWLYERELLSCWKAVNAGRLRSWRWASSPTRHWKYCSRCLREEGMCSCQSHYSSEVSQDKTSLQSRYST
jgi:hypothetical protein